MLGMDLDLIIQLNLFIKRKIYLLELLIKKKISEELLILKITVVGFTLLN